MARKQNASSQSEMIEITYGTMSQALSRIEVADGTTVGQLMELIGASVSSGQTVWVNGQSEELDSILEDGDRVQLIPRKDGGNETAEDAGEVADEDESDEDTDVYDEVSSDEVSA